MIKSRKKVLVLTTTFPRWENDTTPPFVFELEKRLAEDFEIHVLAPHHKESKFQEISENMNIKRFKYFWPSGLQMLCYDGGILPKVKKNKFLAIQGLFLVIAELIATIKIVKKEQIDLIHAHWIIPQGIIALIINKLFNIPYIITSHGSDAFGLQNGLFLKLKKDILNGAQIITVVSESIKGELINKLQIDKNKIQVISMGVNSELFNPNKRDLHIRNKLNITGPFLLFVGRLAEVKGVRYLIESMKYILQNYPSAKLVIVGNGTLKDELVSLAEKLNISGSVIFTGPIPNNKLPSYYATADFFVAPSISTNSGEKEGFGLTIIEAAFSGCVPLGSKIGGISEIIKDNDTGILLEEKNPKDIADKVMNLINNNSLRERIKQQSRKIYIEKYDWKFVSNRFANMYIS